MKAERCLFWATLWCTLYLVRAFSGEDDALDFDLTDLKEIDWNFNNNVTASSTTTAKELWKAGGLENLELDLSAEDKDENGNGENEVLPFGWREKILRNALSKAMTNKVVRQKFIEIIPILRVLTRQQRLALSAIVSAQINTKKGQDLRLEQVRQMFGDDKKLLIPIIFDIANLVRNSAKKYLQFSYDFIPSTTQYQKQQLPQLERRKLDLVEETENEQDIGALPSAAMPDASLEDFFSEMPPDDDAVLDPQSINEELQASAETTTTKAGSSRLVKRARRHVAAAAAAASPTDFVHKLIRSIPLSVNEEDLQRGAAGRTVKLNTTSFILTTNRNDNANANGNDDDANDAQSSQSYQEIEDLAFASLNGTEINLNSVEQRGNDNMTDSNNNNNINNNNNEPLPNPEELIAGPRYRINGNKIRYIRPKVPGGTAAVSKRKRVHIPRPQQHLRGPAPSGTSISLSAASVPAPKKCERFTASMCIRTEDYPLEQIMGSIRRHKNAMTALLAEYHDKPLNFDFPDDFDEFSGNLRRREDEANTGGNGNGGNGGSMCQSIVRYARPQKARSASGEWKYIVNTGQHTQTLRLEKCSNPQESCSYLAHNYRSHCAQIYNYHRLLSWDKTRGLHVDIFKVPTCCSCQIDGYRQQFPPLDHIIKAKDYSPTYSADPYSTIQEELDYNDDEDEDDLGFQYNNKYNQHKRSHGYDENELMLGSKNVKIRSHAASPTVGSYLSPPGSIDYDTKYSYNGVSQHHQHQHRGSAPTAGASTGSRNSYSHLERRRPYKSLVHDYDTESRADLDISPSEQHPDKEVNIYGTTHANDKTRQVQPKRKRIYSVPHTATTTTTTTSTSSGSIGTISSNSNDASSHRPVDSINSSYVPSSHEHEHRYRAGYGHAKREHGQGLIGSSSGATASHKTTAASSSSPSYYTPGDRTQHIIRGGGGVGGASARGGYANTRSRITPAATSQSIVPLSPATASLPTTESTNTYHRQSMASEPYPPPLYNIGSIFNTTHGHAVHAVGGSKRINYSYHPIIDFFENNNGKRSLSTSSPSLTTSKSSPIYPTISSYDDYPTRTSLDSNGQLYPHKIPKYSSISRSQPGGDADLITASNMNSFQRSRERRIGVGAGDDPNLRKSTNSADDNVWHPVLI